MGQLIEELKRRNVIRVAIAYTAIAWLVMQVADVVLESFGAPAWVMKTLLFALAIGLVLAVLFAWAYELTPDGLKREKDVDRSQSITQNTGRRLNRLITVLLVAAVAFLMADKFLLREPLPTDEGASRDKSVAVLPFVAMSRGEDDEYFADGLTEEILNSLTRVPELLVTARTSAFFFKGKDIPIPEIAGKLGVAHVVEGSVRRDGNRLRVTAQLIRADDGFHLWSKTYDRDTEDTFGVQTDIAEKIAIALGIFLDEQTLERMNESGFRNPEAYVAFQKGLELYNKAHDDWDIVPLLAEANEWFDKVIALEPGAAAAHLKRADLYTHLLRDVYDTLSEDEISDAITNLDADLGAAVRNAPDDASRWSARFDEAFLTGDWGPIVTIADEYAKAVTCPNSSWVNSFGGAFGRAEAVMAVALKTRQCDPHNPFGWRDGASAAVWAGMPDVGTEIAEAGIEIVDSDALIMSLAFSYVATGRMDDARRRIEKVRDEGFRYQLNLLLAAAQGDAELTESLARELVERRADRSDIQLMYIPMTGDRETANRLAANIDAQPWGHVTLEGITDLCKCGAPWDIEVTPNFARKLKEAGLSWPPASPIRWPLKDW